MARGPLAVFRKHQKKLLAIFGVAIMIAFLLPSATSITPFFGGRGHPGQEDGTVVHWKGGKKSESEMANLRAGHMLLLQFLGALANTAVSKGGNPQGIGVERDPQTGMVIHPGIRRDISEPALFQSVLLAAKAREMRLVVDDQAIEHFLRQITGGVLSRGEIQSVRYQVLGDRIDEYQLRVLLREALLAQKVQILASGGALVAAPGISWDYFQRLQRFITADIKPLAVADFVEQTPQPSDDNIEDLYDEYKDEVPNPVAATIGFKRPRRASVEYLAADMKKFQEELKLEITDEEVRKYYEENLDSFKRTRPPDDETQDTLDDDPRSATPRPPVPHQVMNDSDPRQALSRPPVPPLTSDVIALPNQPHQSDLATVADEPTESSADETADEESSSDPDYGHKPLEEVATTIRSILVRPKAYKQLSDQLNKAKRKLSVYFEDYRLWLAKKEQGDHGAEPKRPDFQELADEFGLEVGVVPLVEAHDMFTFYDIGRSRPLDSPEATSFNDLVFGRNLLLYMPKQSLSYDHIKEIERYYVFWKTGAKEERTPLLDEIRDEVELAWKTREAFDLAWKKAKEIAGKLNSIGGSLADQQGETSGREVFEIGPVSWLTVSSFSPEDPRGEVVLSTVEGIADGGVEFMRNLFSIGAGQAGPAANRTKTVVYVAQVKTENPDIATLRKDYFKSLDENQGIDPLIYRIARLERRRLVQQWYNELENEWDVVWKRPPQLATVSR